MIGTRAYRMGFANGKLCAEIGDYHEDERELPSVSEWATAAIDAGYEQNSPQHADYISGCVDGWNFSNDWEPEHPTQEEVEEAKNEILRKKANQIAKRIEADRAKRDQENKEHVDLKQRLANAQEAERVLQSDNLHLQDQNIQLTREIQNLQVKYDEAIARLSKTRRALDS